MKNALAGCDNRQQGLYIQGTGSMPVLSSSWLISILQSSRGCLACQTLLSMALPSICSPNNDLSVPVLLHMMRLLSSRIIAPKAWIHLSLHSRTQACLGSDENSPIPYPCMLSRWTLEERLRLIPHSAAASNPFSTLKEPFIACLSKTQATMSLHTGSSHSVRGCCLGLRPAFASESTFYEK